MKKNKKELECYVCELKFTLQYKGKRIPQCCPFCGEGIDVVEDAPVLMGFDEYDAFDDQKYFDDEDNDFDEDDEE